MAKTPTKFGDLSKDELIRSAVEDFAIELSDDEKKGKNTVLAAFAESNILWEDYVSQHPEVAPEPAVVTSNAPSHSSVEESTQTGFITPVVEDRDDNGQVPYEAKPNMTVQTAQPLIPANAGDQPFLLKMTRENAVYQTRGYEFTEEHPYALVSAADAQWILENEKGFRQAFPQELADFYG
jgi:hypothetical protein